MTRWALTFSAPQAFDPYELVPGETTVIGRAPGYADAAFRVDTLARRHAAIRWRGGSDKGVRWLLERNQRTPS